ncbi:hypothetical protein SNN76_001317 [Cronobacter turicensis]|nr:hypothetical protein [Cronobacter turicensis]ELY4321657.1 hypothetical protein [Cronobacter turicensis]ELY5942649.1 hypothetical protein [Cronobacter turicensis]ELY5962727.1 hypothetical protein [Cronobacter turicensis]
MNKLSSTPRAPLNFQPLTLEASRIKAHRWWLKVSAVRPGDILLVQNPGLQSAGIRFADGSLFSHAALWMHSGEQFQPERLAEADGHGIGFTDLPVITIDNEGVKSEVWLMPGNPRHCKLLRHRDIESVPESIAKQAAEEMRNDWFYSDYAYLHRLADASRHPPAVRRLYSVMLQGIDRVASKKHGRKTLFCSELVAVYYEKIGLTLFDPPKDPALVSPASLAHHAVGLYEVQGAFVNTDALADTAIASGLHLDDPRAQGWLPLHVNQARKGYQLDKLDSTLKESIATLRKHNLENYRAAHEDCLNRLAKLEQLALIVDKPQAMKKITTYRKSEQGLYNLLVNLESSLPVTNAAGHTLTLSDEQEFHLSLRVLSLLGQLRFSVWKLNLTLLRDVLRGSKRARKPFNTQRPLKLARLYQIYRQLREYHTRSSNTLEAEIKKSAEALSANDVKHMTQWLQAYP